MSMFHKCDQKVRKRIKELQQFCSRTQTQKDIFLTPNSQRFIWTETVYSPNSEIFTIPKKYLRKIFKGL